jgi:hypothetical protein
MGVITGSKNSEISMVDTPWSHHQICLAICFNKNFITSFYPLLIGCLAVKLHIGYKSLLFSSLLKEHTSL